MSCPTPVTITTEGATQQVTGIAVDNADNNAQTSFILSIDKTAPTINTAISPAANSNGWHNTDPTVTFLCEDSLSGVKTCSDPITVSTEAAEQIISGSVTDEADNSATTSASINLDKTAPLISASVEPLPNAAGWHNTTVVVSFSCSDALSGVESCPQPVTVELEGADQTISGTAVDLAGNTATTSVVLNIDKTEAIITSLIEPAPNTAGWNNTDATVRFDCSDELSGIAECSIPITVVTEGMSQPVIGQAVDVADNLSTMTATLNIDKTSPTISTQIAPAANANGWHNSDPTVTFLCEDSLSGVQACSEPVTVITEAANQAINGSVVDVADNNASTSATINLDKTAPVITASVEPLPNAAGWNNSTVIVRFSCSDGLSDVESCTQPVTVELEGADQTVSGTAVDRAGNSSTTTVTLNIDKTAPLVSVAANPAANAAGWHNNDTTLIYTCSDALSGIATCPADQAVGSEGAAQSFSADAVDVAGNSASASITLQVDKTAPLISSQLDPEPNANGWHNSDVTVSYICSDVLSGMGSCTEPVVISTEGAGQSHTGTAVDVADNTSQYDGYAEHRQDQSSLDYPVSGEWQYPNRQPTGGITRPE